MPPIEKLIPLILIGLFYVVNAYLKQKKANEEKRNPQQPPPKQSFEQEHLPREPQHEVIEEERPVETFQDVLRRFTEQAKAEEVKHKPRKQPKQAAPKKKEKAKTGYQSLEMTPQMIEGSIESSSPVYQGPEFKHVDSSIIIAEGEEQKINFNAREAFINTVILNRPEY